MTPEQQDQIDAAGGLIRALSKCRERATDPVQIEIIRAAQNRAIDQLNSVLARLPTDDLYRLSGIDSLCANILAEDAVKRALEAVSVPIEEQTT